jgi:two-component system response regulator FixJ
MSNENVYIVDDDGAVRDSMAGLLTLYGFHTRQFSSGHEFLQASPNLPPGCVVLDLRMPDMSGLDLQRDLARAGGNFSVMFVTGHGSIAQAVQAMKAGAEHFLEKPVDDTSLVVAVRKALSATAPAVSDRNAAAALASLTPQQREVLSVMANGLSSRAAAQVLGCGIDSIEGQLAEMMKTTNTYSIVQLVRLAIAGGLETR